MQKILATGDPLLREQAAARVVVLATVVGQDEWRSSRRRGDLVAANTASGLHPTPEQLEEQFQAWQTAELARLFRMLSALGGETAMDYAFDVASSFNLPLARRVLAIELAENLMRSGARRHAAQIPKLSAELHGAR